MEIFGKDAIIGDIKLSDYGFMLATFGNSDDDVDLGIDYQLEEVFVGNNPTPFYLGGKHNSKLKFTMTIVQNECLTGRHYFNVNECRLVLTRFIGQINYVPLKIINTNLNEDIHFNVIGTGAKYIKYSNKVVGISIDYECDSQFAWTDNITTKYTTTTNNELIKIYNTSDDMYSYLLPKIEIVPTDSYTNYKIINVTDNNRELAFDNVVGEENISINSKYCTLSTSPNRPINNYFNLIFPRLVYGENILKISHPSSITFNFEFARKVGLM